MVKIGDYLQYTGGIDISLSSDVKYYVEDVDYEYAYIKDDLDKNKPVLLTTPGRVPVRKCWIHIPRSKIKSKEVIECW